MLNSSNWKKRSGFYVKAVNIDNDMVSAHRSLGFLFLRTNRVANSIIHFEEALRIEPQDLQSAMYLADILSTHPSDTVRNGSRAMELVAVMMQQGGEGNWQVLVTAAAALAADDEFEQAIEGLPASTPGCWRRCRSPVEHSTPYEPLPEQAAVPGRSRTASSGSAWRTRWWTARTYARSGTRSGRTWASHGAS